MRFFTRRKQQRVEFRHPLDPAPKTAILRGGYRSTRQVRVFPDGWTVEAEKFEPSVVAGSLPQLREIATREVVLRHALVVFSEDAASRLTEAQRDELWATFGLPVFEQIVGPANELIAAECDAHDGLHVFSGTPDEPLEYAPCACGSEVPRLMERRGKRMLAASA